MGNSSRLRTRLPTIGLLAWFVLAVDVHTQQRDPRIGEWREDRYPNAVGLYMVYEDLGNGMTRVHAAENLAPRNRLHQDIRCDGKFYPSVDAEAVPAGVSTTCTIVDARTVTSKLIRNTEQGSEDGEGTWTLSSDGNHFTTVAVWKDRDGKVKETNERRFTRNSENCVNHDRDDLFRDCVRRSRPR